MLRTSTYNKFLLKRRRERIRNLIRRRNPNKFRLTVHRSNQHIYAQIIDDNKRITLASASSLTKEFKDLSENITNGSNKQAAKLVGILIAKNAIKSGIEEVVFDRSGFLYHGRIKELANGAREGGLKF